MEPMEPDKAGTDRIRQRDQRRFPTSLQALKASAAGSARNEPGSAGRNPPEGSGNQKRTDTAAAGDCEGRTIFT